MIEKLGHTKRMQAVRKEWINEGKPGDDHDSGEPMFENSGHHQSSAASVQHPVPDAHQAVRKRASDQDISSEDKAFRPTEALPRAEENPFIKATADSIFLSDVEEGNDAPLEDDLDVLLAEHDVKAKIQRSAPAQHHGDSGEKNDNFDDEMEAMAGLDEMRCGDLTLAECLNR